MLDTTTMDEVDDYLHAAVLARLGQQQDEAQERGIGAAGSEPIGLPDEERPALGCLHQLRHGHRRLQADCRRRGRSSGIHNGGPTSSSCGGVCTRCCWCHGRRHGAQHPPEVVDVHWRQVQHARWRLLRACSDAAAARETRRHGHCAFAAGEVPSGGHGHHRRRRASRAVRSRCRRDECPQLPRDDESRLRGGCCCRSSRNHGCAFRAGRQAACRLNSASSGHGGNRRRSCWRCWCCCACRCCRRRRRLLRGNDTSGVQKCPQRRCVSRCRTPEICHLQTVRPVDDDHVRDH